MTESATTPPATDEIEVSVFGPGYGEAIAVHLGAGRWICVDSCLSEGQPAALTYLKAIGVDVATQVIGVVASHWHDDHVRGLASLVDQCSSAIFYYPAALSTDEFQAYAQILNSGDPSPFARETSEIVRTFRHLEKRQRRVAAVMTDRLLLDMGGGVEVFALSPNDLQYGRFISNLASITPRASPPTRRARIGSLAPNETAIVIQVRTPVGTITLGSDLEEYRVLGWSTMITQSAAIRPGSMLLKVAHHGSANAHHDEFWQTYRAPGCIAVLTPFTRGSVKLPTPSDVARIERLGNRNFITALSVARSNVRRTPEVARALREGQIRLRRAQPKPGHVRIRPRAGGPSKWDVALFDGAAPLAHEAA